MPRQIRKANISQTTHRQYRSSQSIWTHAQTSNNKNQSLQHSNTYSPRRDSARRRCLKSRESLSAPSLESKVKRQRLPKYAKFEKKSKIWSHRRSGPPADPQLVVNPHKTKKENNLHSQQTSSTSIIDEFTVRNHRNGGYHGKFGRESKMQCNYHIECSTKE